jgi:hypothetical protein
MWVYVMSVITFLGHTPLSLSYKITNQDVSSLKQFAGRIPLTELYSTKEDFKVINVLFRFANVFQNFKKGQFEWKHWSFLVTVKQIETTLKIQVPISVYFD